MESSGSEQRQRWNRRLKAVALGLGLALTALTVRHGYETFTFGHPLCENCRADFPSLYSGAKLIWENPGALYDLQRQLAIQKNIDPRIGESALAYAYPPVTALLLMPLGWLSFANAYLVMAVVNGLLLLVAFKLLVRSLQLHKEQIAWLGLATLCNFGVHSTILQGQTSILTLLLIVLFMRSTCQANSTAAGLSSGALFFKPQLVAVPFLILATRRLWRAAILGAVLIVGLSALSALLVGVDGIADYLRIARRFSASASDLGTNPQDMHNLRALVFFGFAEPQASYIWFASSALVAAGVYLLNAANRQDEIASGAQWIGNVAAMLLLSPHLHAHDLALLAVPSAWLLKLFKSEIPSRVAILLIAVGLYPLLPVMLSTNLLPVIPLLLLIALAISIRAVQRLP